MCAGYQNRGYQRGKYGCCSLHLFIHYAVILHCGDVLDVCLTVMKRLPVVFRPEGPELISFCASKSPFLQTISSRKNPAAKGNLCQCIFSPTSVVLIKQNKTPKSPTPFLPRSPWFCCRRLPSVTAEPWRRRGLQQRPTGRLPTPRPEGLLSTQRIQRQVRFANAAFQSVGNLTVLTTAMTRSCVGSMKKILDAVALMRIELEKRCKDPTCNQQLVSENSSL